MRTLWLLAFVASGTLAAAGFSALADERGTPTMITNAPVWSDGKAVAWPDMGHPAVQTAFLYQPTSEWTYSHHSHLTFFRGKYYAIWSNGRTDEDAPGQRVLLSSSADFVHWSAPTVLATPPLGTDGVERVLTAAGFHQHKETLVAYYGEYGPNKECTRLMAVTTRDGVHWSAPLAMGVPVNPNHGPQATSTGRLIICGNISFPYTDDPAGLTGWRMAGIYPPSMAGTSDDPASFWGVAKQQRWPAALCEGSFYETPDRVLHMLLRATGPGFRGRLWLSESWDNGATWSAPRETEFSDDNAKFHFGRLPDGRWYYVGNPLAGNRCPLVLSLSRDGARFDHHFVLGETHYEARRAGRWKGGEYGYPHSMVHGGWLCVIVSRQKEAVEVMRVRIADL